MSSSAKLRGFPRFNCKIIACHLARLQFRVALIFALDENQRPVGVGGQHFRAGNWPAAKLAPIFALTRIFIQDEALQPWRRAILSAQLEDLPSVVGGFVEWPCDQVRVCYLLLASIF